MQVLKSDSQTCRANISFIFLAASHPSVIINESDIGLHNLHTTRQLLLKQLENLEFQVAENEEKARQYIKENKRLLAKTYLRKKHLLEKSHGNFVKT